MSRVLRFVRLLVTISLLLGMSSSAVLADEGGTVDPKVGVYQCLGMTFHRSLWYAEGQYWAFYYNGTGIVYKSSWDGLTWTGDDDTLVDCNAGKFSITFDGTYFHWSGPDSRSSLVYRRGNPDVGGHITWDPIQDIGPRGIDFTSVTVDSNGSPWISYCTSLGSNMQVFVTGSVTKEGVWTTSEGFPVQITEESDCGWTPSIEALLDGKVAVLYSKCVTPLYCRVWDGLSWGSEEVALGKALGDGKYYSSLVVDGVLYVAGGETRSLQIWSNSRSLGGQWGNPQIVGEPEGTVIIPALSWNSKTKELYCFWTGYPSPYHLYYKILKEGSWEKTLTDWVDCSSDGIPGNARYLSAFCTTMNGWIGVLYVTNTDDSSSYQLKARFLGEEKVQSTPVEYVPPKIEAPVEEIVEEEVVKEEVEGDTTWYTPSGQTVPLEPSSPVEEDPPQPDSSVPLLLIMGIVCPVCLVGLLVAVYLRRRKRSRC